MSSSSTHSMHISFQDFEFSEGITLSKSDIACAIFLNDNCVDKLYFNKDSVGKLPITNSDDRLRFIFRSKQNGAILGCISFLTKTFYSLIDKKFSHWLTLFDCPEDDEFDGELGEDDEEEPRVLLQYQIKNDYQADNVSTPKKSQKMDSETNSEIQHKYNSNASYTTSSPLKTNQIFNQEETESFAIITKNTEVEENITSVAPQLQYSFNHETHPEFLKENNSFYEMKETPRLEPKPSPNEPLSLINSEQAQKELDTKSFELQINSFVKILQEKRENNSEFKLDQEPDPARYESHNEGQYLLHLEYERNTKLQEILKLTENRLVTVENAYQELDNKSKVQIQSLVDKNRATNQDNQYLREKIQELEEKLESVLEKASEQVEAYSEKCSRQLELAAAEDHRTKNRTLEKLNTSLKEELLRMKNISHQEKELNQNLQAQLEIISNQFRQDVNAMKEMNNLYNEQINQLSNELFKSREKYTEVEVEVSNLTTIKNSLESELQIKSSVIANLKKEMQDYRKLTEDLRKTIRDSRANNEREVVLLKQNIAVVEENLRKQEWNNKEIYEQANEMHREIECYKAKGLEDKIKIQMKELEDYELTNKNLKEIIEKCKCGLLFGNSEDSKAQIESELEKEKRIKLEEKLQTLALKHQEQMVKFQVVNKENFELKASVEDLEREREQYHQSLEKIKTLQEENQQLWNSLSGLKHHLALNAAELVNQVGQVISQKEVIKNLNEKLQPPEIKTISRHLDFQAEKVKTQSNVKKTSETKQMTQSAKLKEDHSESQKEIRSVKENIQMGIERQDSSKSDSRIETLKYKSSEIDQKLKELMKKTKIPMKFVRIGEGLYVFGSKRVNVRALDGKLVIRIRGAYLYIEEFIRLYAHQELTKLKTMKGEISYTNIEDENLPSDVDKAHIIYDNGFNSLSSENTETPLSLLCSPVKEDFPEKKFVLEGVRSASVSYRGPEANWPLRKEVESNREHNVGSRSSKAKHGHIKASPSVEFSPRFQNHEDDIRKWASNNYSEQKAVKENNVGKKETLRK